jgi:hypothetical protein
MKKIIILISTITILVIGIFACSRQPSPQDQISTNSQQSTNTKDQISKPTPLSVKPKEAKNTQNKPPNNYRESPINKTDTFIISDKTIAIAATIAAFLQFLGLCVVIYITIRNARRQLRAYVFIETVDLTNIFGNAPAGQPLSIGPWIFRPPDGPIAHITIRNSGTTPAFEEIHISDIVMKEYPLKSKLVLPKRAPYAGVACIAPRVTTMTSIVMPHPLTPEELSELRDGKIAIYVHGEITYRDAFNKKHFTRYRLRHNGYSGIIGQTTVMNICEEGNEAN